jgi:hypothetical protein
MIGSTKRGSISIIIKLPSPQVLASSKHAAVQTAVSKLLERLDRQKLAATWAFANPATSSFAKNILARGHEISLLADAANSNQTISRQQFVRSIGMQLKAAAQAGCPVSTILIDNPAWLAHTDLLIKHGVKVICGPQSTGTLSGVQKISFSLYQIGASAVLSGGAWAANRSQMRAFDRSLNQAIATGGICLLQIELESLLANSDGSLPTVDVVSSSLAQLRDDGHVLVSTVREMIEKLGSTRKKSPAVSILRAA